MDSKAILRKDPEELTFSDLRCHYPTGQSFVKYGSGRDRVYGYRHGIMTDLGNIEESEWIALVKQLIQKAGEEEIQEQLQRLAKDRCIWLHTKKGIERHALENHAARLFDNPQWVDYELFNREYRSQCKSKEGKL